MSWISATRERLRGLFFRSREDAEMDEEMRFHLEMETERRMREDGLDRAEARRQAGIAFGGVEKHREEVRDARGLAWVTGLSLDFRLGVRMLVKYPGLTLVGGLAMAFAIWVGAATFELVTQVLRPTLPLHEGSRVVGIRLWNAAASRPERKVLHDFAAWRAELVSIEDVGAFRALERNLVTGDGRGEPVEVAEISASAFRVARVPPLMGRALVEEDERPGAPPVAVIGHALWKRRFGGDPGAVGRTVRLGSTEHTVVGVMPEGFAFPIAHAFWVPLRVDGPAAPRQGPALQVFGRLAEGATMESARAELEAMGRRAAAASPGTHARLVPQVMPYARSIVDVAGWKTLGLLSVNVPVLLFLVLVCANVALLMFARAATREAEIVVRSALGASRGRIVAQLFAEALVLGTVAAAVGLAAAGLGLRWVTGTVVADLLNGKPLPFWFSARLSPTTVLYAILLTAFGAVIAGVVPALKVTRSLSARLRQVGTGGGGLRFGGVWTAVIVAQVAVTVAFPAVAWFTRRDGEQIRQMRVAAEAGEYLSARLEMDRQPPAGAPADTSRAAFRERFRASYRALEARLAADPAVAGVTFADRLPRMYHPARLLEMDEGGAAPLDPRWPGGYRVSSAAVGPGFFGVLETPVVAGRAFTSGEHEAEGRVVVVNQSFVKLVLGGRNPVGRRVRYLHFEEWDGPADDEEASPWYEIVGVVPDLGMATDVDPKVAGLYHPVPAGGAYPAQMAVHVRGDPEAFAPRLRALATAVDPTLRLYEPVRMDEVNQTALAFVAFWFRLALGVSSLALLLSLAGIYSVMSFTVSRRTREIGIRVALGASRRRVVAAIFARPLRQVAVGIAAGATLVGLLMMAATGGDATPRGVALLGAYAAFMMAVCALACVSPTRRALRVEPTEALRADG